MLLTKCSMATHCCPKRISKPPAHSDATWDDGADYAMEMETGECMESGNR
jgi:hypothetical protein